MVFFKFSDMHLAAGTMWESLQQMSLFCLHTQCPS